MVHEAQHLALVLLSSNRVQLCVLKNCNDCFFNIHQDAVVENIDPLHECEPLVPCAKQTVPVLRVPAIKPSCKAPTCQVKKGDEPLLARDPKPPHRNIRHYRSAKNQNVNQLHQMGMISNVLFVKKAGAYYFVTTPDAAGYIILSVQIHLWPEPPKKSGIALDVKNWQVIEVLHYRSCNMVFITAFLLENCGPPNSTCNWCTCGAKLRTVCPVGPNVTQHCKKEYYPKTITSSLCCSKTREKTTSKKASWPTKRSEK